MHLDFVVELLMIYIKLKLITIQSEENMQQKRLKI